MVSKEAGLGNQTILAKIDKLRELNVGTIIPLPQLVVVGDQSSGKSSVLESLTGFAFPRGTKLCTRYATQITCRREVKEGVSVSIIPRPGADDDLKAKLIAFRRDLPTLDNQALALIFAEANEAMRIRPDIDDANLSLDAFSQDILKIEISGPDQTHLTVIDVPGIFRVATPGLTTKTDAAMVRNMVKAYIANRRTIILAVIPCNVDIATQEILKLSDEADPDGVRTMGVLTKPDLVTEKATHDVVMDLVLGNRNPLKLGYYVVKNRGADDSTSTISDRFAAERDFFMSPPWMAIADRCGIPALKESLRELLMKISKQEIPIVKLEIEKRLRECRLDLEAMGPSRSSQSSQRLFLGRIASRFQAVTQSALNGHYSNDPIFDTVPNMKLVTAIMDLNETLSDVFWRRGHKRRFGTEKTDGEEIAFSDEEAPFDFDPAGYPELSDIICSGNYVCQGAIKGPIEQHIRAVFKFSRGPEVGTFGGTILPTAFKEQSEKWEALTLAYTSKAIVLVHSYICQLLASICPQKQIKIQLLDNLLIQKSRSAYLRALNHARFLLAMEREGTPSTVNHYFNANLQKKRNERQAVVDRDNTQQVCEDIADSLASYYKVARKRFVDSVCQQVVNHFLLNDKESPLKILSPDLIMGLDDEQLGAIAGEDAVLKHQRHTLEREIGALDAALKVLGGN
ncbi:interferon-induced GTP-binding protein Mx2 [Nemania diffusa]|nr:interferon-induced GTP-binding protein Mx2 [Nemania diffusa]